MPSIRNPLGRLAITLFRARKYLGLTLRQMEPRTGLSNPYLSQLETGAVTNPTVAALVKVARGYKIPVHDLVDAAIASQRKEKADAKP